MKTSSDMSEAITPQRLNKLCASANYGVLLDVRTPAEFEEAHIDGARLEPLDRLDPQELVAEFGTQPVHVICQSGKRAAQAIEKLQRAGCSAAVLLEGGMNAWVADKLPVNRGAKTMSLERQVRITAGALVVIVTLLGWALSLPALHGISAFIGAGLVYAGLTDSCAMGMFIAKMPWNRRVRSPARS